MATNPTNQIPKPPLRPAGRRVIPLGEPLGWNANDIERMAETTEGDKLNALEFWERHAPRTFRQLLRANTRKPKN